MTEHNGSRPELTPCADVIILMSGLKRIFTAMIGGTVLLIGLALLVLPGPGLPLVAAGLAILTGEFVWARRALRNAKGALAKARRQSGLGAWLKSRRRVKGQR